MVQPVWNTAAGSLGTFPSGTRISIQLRAVPVFPGTFVTFKLLSGTLPSSDSIQITEDGMIVGTLGNVPINTTSEFTIRCTDDARNIKDRTFSITVSGAVSPTFTTPPGRLLETFDSQWIDLQIQYTNLVSSNKITIQKTLGKLPPGLEINELGRIRGYPLPPTTFTGSPGTTTYNFTLSLHSDLGNDARSFSITVKNWRLTNPTDSRVPAILNTRPLTYEVDSSDPLNSYYLTTPNIPVSSSGDYFAFKIIGYDFEGSALFYDFKNLPLGLVGNSTTGWITGIPTLGAPGIYEYSFSVRVQKATKRVIASQYQEFKFIISRGIKNDLVWVTPSHLGYIPNGQISDFFIKANSRYNLQYRLTGGTLPPNLRLLETGDLVGRVAQQPKSEIMGLNDQAEWTFEVEAFSPQFPLLIIKKTFTVGVIIEYPDAYENLYFKANLNLNDRKVLEDLLTREELIPREMVYRPDDPYFGKAKNISYVHAYGMKSSTIEKYIESVAKNHYWRQIILGDLKTAVAKDQFGNVVYEVVYSQISDNLVNSQGVSVPPRIFWPRDINLNLGPWQISSTDIYTSFEDVLGQQYTTSLTPGTTRELFPASFKNMREEIGDNIGENFSSSLLPRWMTTQQSNGVILGYIQAWVVCYTKPGFSETVRENIFNNWLYRVNRFDFVVDRYMVEKTATFDHNNYLTYPRWNQLPSGTPEPNPLDENDFIVLFPRKTILPKNVDY